MLVCRQNISRYPVSITIESFFPSEMGEGEMGRGKREGEVFGRRKKLQFSIVKDDGKRFGVDMCPP